MEGSGMTTCQEAGWGGVLLCTTEYSETTTGSLQRWWQVSSSPPVCVCRGRGGAG